MGEDALSDAEIGARAASRPTAKQVGAVLAGNALEFYDFLTYAFFAAQIGRTFFPSATPTASLLASLATFGVGFMMRPVGAFVIGRMGDRVGRKPAMILSFSLMGIGVAGLTLTPSYAAIGLAAPVLAVLFRMVQGFALGGEVGPSTAFLLEISPPEKRGFYASLQYMTQNASVLAAGLVGLLLASLLTPGQLDAWGWRVAMGLGVIIVPFGLIMRRALTETLHDHHDEPAAPAGWRPYLKIWILGLMMLASGTIVTYSLTYLNTYAQTTLGMAATAGFGATVTLGLVGMMMDPIGGMLSDRFGRKPMAMIPWVILLFTIWPSFWLLTHVRTTGVLLSIAAGMTVLFEIAAVSMLVSVTETLPRKVRSGALALIYALAISTFGGSTQFVVAWLIDVTGDPLVPAWYMMAAVAVGLVAVGLMKESAPARLAAQAPPVLEPARA